MSYGRERPLGIEKQQRSVGKPPASEVDVEQFSDVDVAIVCESTYPYLTGGLSAVVHQICEANPDRRIGIIHIAWDRDSPSIPLYDVPPQVAWVKTVYQALVEHSETFLNFRPSDMGLTKKERAKVSDRVFGALRRHLAAMTPRCGNSTTKASTRSPVATGSGQSSARKPSCCERWSSSPRAS